MLLGKTTLRCGTKRSSDSSAFAFRWRYALLVFLLALAFRGFYLLEAGHRADFNLFYMDEEYHLKWAESLATGIWNPPYDQLRDSAYFRAPLYPYFLAGLLALFKGGTLGPRIVQIILGSISCALAYGVAARCFGQRVGLIAGILCSFYWVLAYFDSQFLLPVLLVLLLLLGMLLAFLAAERESPWLAGSAGVAMGLYAITRPNILVFFPFLIWWAIGVGGKSFRLRRWFVVLLVVGLLLPPAVVTFRNYAVAHDWVVVASQGGVNFYIGNNPESNGMQAVVPGTRQTWWGGYEDTRILAEEAAGHALKPSEISDYWFGRALDYIRNQPVNWLGLTLRKMTAFVSNAELPNNEPYEFFRKEFRTLRLIPLSFSLIFGLFLVSLPLTLSRLKSLGRSHDRGAKIQAGFIALMLQLILIYSLTVIAFFVTGRYRVPLLPFFAMGAAITIVSVLDLLRQRALLRATIILGISAVMVAILSIDFLGIKAATLGFGELTLAQDRLATGDRDGAIVLLEKIRREQSVRAPEVYKALAWAYLQSGLPQDRESAFEVAEEGLRSYPDEAELLWYSAVGHVSAGNWAQAKDRIDRFLQEEPQNIRAIFLAFRVSMALHDIQSAEAYLQRARALDPDNPLVSKMLQELTPAHP